MKTFKQLRSLSITGLASIAILWPSLSNANQDWTAIEAAAREEGKVVIYSVSSRISKLVEEFKEKYGVEIEGHDLSSDVQLEKFRREHKAGIFNVDVLFNQDAPLLVNEFLDKQLIHNFVPDDSVSQLDKDEMDPMLIQRWSSRILVYNKAKHPKGAPFDNLWDLTKPEWKGRLQMPNPSEDSNQSNVLQTILLNPDEMGKAYEKEFGEKLVYSEAVAKAIKKHPLIDKPDASIEWLYRLLKNKPVFISSTTQIFKNVGDVKQDNPPIGFTTFSKLRKNEPGEYEAEPAYDVEPVFGVAYPTALVIADGSPHPNAAKLLIRHMMGKGFKPWNVIGDYAARTDIAEKQIAKFNIPKFNSLKLWRIDPSAVYDSKYSFLTLYLYLKK
ncbi:MAG: ABC transporter substrate-binding protein [Desulfobacterales bacterium]|nr:ABC transporter substrate-binding protein [Desulfobacterales bacterium]